MDVPTTRTCLRPAERSSQRTLSVFIAELERTESTGSMPSSPSVFPSLITEVTLQSKGARSSPSNTPTDRRQGHETSQRNRKRCRDGRRQRCRPKFSNPALDFGNGRRAAKVRSSRVKEPARLPPSARRVGESLLRAL